MIVEKYIYMFGMVWHRGKEFVLDFCAQFLYFPIKFIILYFVWQGIYGDVNTGTGYSVEELLGYYFILAIMETVMMPCAVTAYEEWDDISHGSLSLVLTKPIHYVLSAYVRKLGEFAVQFLFGTFFLILTQIILRNHIDLHIALAYIPVFFIALFLGFTIMISLFQIVGHVTFWVENILSLRDNLWNVIKIFSGEIFPIAMYPAFFAKICNVLPFQCIYYIPISILQGKLNDAVMMKSLLSELIWGVCLMLLNFIIWNRGLRRYTAQGG